MPLLSLFKDKPETVSEFTIQQVVAFAGDGKLKDNSNCSIELREYISKIDSKKLTEYIEQCLSESFDKSGQALQDIVNELGRRLDYRVENGLYAGRVNAIGNDGLWFAPEGNALVVEVKTSDAYRLSLDTIAAYRDALRREGKVSENSSILLVVGRQSTGELEAQVRGSRHAWDVRLISVEALMKLVLLKENSDQEETGRKIRSVLVPVEYTRVDALVDVVFATASDVESDIPDVEIDRTRDPISDPVAAAVTSGKSQIQDKRNEIIRALSKLLDQQLVKKSRAMWWSSDHCIRVACTISKRYQVGSDYWYAFHPSWNDFLSGGEKSYFVLGCTDLDRAFFIPISKFVPLLPKLHTTTNERAMYWHVQLNTDDIGRIRLLIPKGEDIDMEGYAIRLDDVQSA